MRTEGEGGGAADIHGGVSTHTHVHTEGEGGGAADIHGGGKHAHALVPSARSHIPLQLGRRPRRHWPKQFGSWNPLVAFPPSSPPPPPLPADPSPLPSLARWVFWPAVNMVNFMMVSPTHRVAYVNAAGTVWNAYMSWNNAKQNVAHREEPRAA